MVRIIEKGWGREIVYANEEEYCGKMLIYDKVGAKSSMHFHKNKKETWYVLEGTFNYSLINTVDGSIFTTRLKKGETITNKPFVIHQLEALEDDSIILEVSTSDNYLDNHRVMPGDSQK